ASGKRQAASGKRQAASGKRQAASGKQAIFPMPIDIAQPLPRIRPETAPRRLPASGRRCKTSPVRTGAADDGGRAPAELVRAAAPPLPARF
ncbi:hypothetical protein, partial [Burkholderia mallei]|uniref:hypothetical protein n=2 Tax=pseudomallei group TaxID=111527 RepID=UPI0027B8F43B